MYFVCSPAARLDIRIFGLRDDLLISVPALPKPLGKGTGNFIPLFAIIF